MIAVGIDIGVTGAVAFIDSRGSVVIEDLPAQVIEGKRVVRRELDPRGFLDIMRQHVPANDCAVAAIESLHAMPGNGAATGLSLGDSQGVLRTVLEVMRIRTVRVVPATWQRHYGVFGSGSTKADHLAVARRLYPAAAPRLVRAKDNNRADALLIAHWLLTKEYGPVVSRAAVGVNAIEFVT